jgi:serine/threonine protein kinase
LALTVENLCGLLIRSRLHPADGVKALYQRWQGEARDKANVKAFSRWLVDKRYLTPYQATLLSSGYADNFFLGNYKILDRIGKGRMAGVYKAVHPSGQVVAIKVLPASKARDPQTLARFQREAQLATQLVHHSVVRTFHHGECNGLHYLVMEYLEGDTLEALLQARGKLPPREAVRIAFLTCLGLQHIHEKGMVHRDLKPGNLMICPAPGLQESTLRSMVKILDIGLGRTLFDPKSRDQEDLTGEGIILGTPDYLAPEQARDARKVDIRADLYSLGCALYHMLSGQPPFPDTNPVRQILRHANEVPKPLQELKVEAPDELNQIVATLLAKDPAQRYPTPAKTADALRNYLGTEADAAKGKIEPKELTTYLESLNKGAEPAEADATVSESVPVQFPLPAKVTARPAKPPPSRAAVVTAKKRRRERLTKLGAAQTAKAPVAAPVAAPQAAKAPAATPGTSTKHPVAKPAGPLRINVELVDVESARRAPLGLPIHRDVFMLLVGAVVGATAVLGIVLVVWILAMLLQSGGGGEVPQ